MCMCATERKVIVLGDSGVGKTALIARFITGKFLDAYEPTKGAVPRKKAITVDGKAVSLVIWDIAGHMLSIHPAHVSDAHGAILVCDLSRQVSTDAMLHWHNIVKEKAGDIPVLVAGNKSDIAVEDRCHALKDAGMKGYKTSAKTGENVETLFIELIRATL